MSAAREAGDPPFRKILIANRGEIACRIIKTCQRLGIATVAVYSEADAGALFTRMADERVPIGPGPAADSYLRIDRIVEACRATHAEAVHPGYGFLSERVEFATTLEEAGLVFIGPPARAISAMGDKIESKRIARAAGVTTVPGTLEAITDPAEAMRIAREIGFPLMVKASAGGGGKGMRIVFEAGELAMSLERARSEARSSFGDDRVFIEKYIEEPRHIEIQVLGDRYGSILHLGERECSIQRRHQKVIEEAPSPFLDSATREAMGRQAIDLAAAVGYYSAGTVEFIVDKNRQFYFLEMNTRLQVEHPVTEAVHRLDLVELMIRIAAGERLDLRQEDLRADGWAIEARVYAEDPRRGFLPSVGRLVRYEEPTGERVRIDSGVVEGGEVSLFYDAMIAKVVGTGPDRASAIRELQGALDGLVIRGPEHNVSFLNAVLDSPRFVEGRLATDFIAAEFGERFAGVELSEQRCRELAAALVAMRLREAHRAALISGRLQPVPLPLEPAWTVELGQHTIDLVVLDPDAVPLRIRIEGDESEVSLDWRPGRLVVEAIVDGLPIRFQADPISEGYHVRHRGAEMPALIRTRRAADLAAGMPRKEPPDADKDIRSPMPGLILRISVAAGQEVKTGQELMVLEAMKMENVLIAEREGKIGEINVQERDTVAADQVLLTFATFTEPA